VRFGSSCGGGRYDGLVSRFRGEPVPRRDFQSGVAAAGGAYVLGKLDVNRNWPGWSPVDRERVALPENGRHLRSASVRASFISQPEEHGHQLNTPTTHSPCVIIQGSDEKDDPAGRRSCSRISSSRRIVEA